MKKIIYLFFAILMVFSTLSGCNKDDTVNGNNSEGVSSSNPVDVEFVKNTDKMFTERDLKNEYDENAAIIVKLNENTVNASSDSVKISGNTITLTEDATHIISGTLNDGMIIVNAPNTAKMQIVFDGVNINSKTSAPLYILECDKVFLTLAEGTQNSLSNSGEYKAIDENNIDSVIFSKQDLTLNGTGSLSITSPAGHGIVSKDDLVITGGNYTVNSASHGIDANDSIRVSNADIKIDAGKDGLHAENNDDEALGYIYISSGNFEIEAEGDGISAASFLQIENGNINITAGGGWENGTKESSDFWGGFKGGGKPQRSTIITTTSDDSSTSMKGIKASNKMLISNGNITINSADDAIHSDVSLAIIDGNLKISTGDDALHAEQTLDITSGDINITESYEGIEALNINIKGGSIKLKASDDGLNAAGGNDSSGIQGGRDGMFGGMGSGRPGKGNAGGMSSNANGSIEISGGTLYINASGDGIDANGTLLISGGYTTVVGPTQGDTSTLDYDKSSTITGGTFIGTGASNMAQSFSENKQGVIAISVGNQSAKTKIVLKDKNGKEIISYSPELSFQIVIISSPEIKAGETYSISVGSTSGDIKAS